MVSGYKLELLLILVQTFQPLDKGAVKIVNPCPNQYLSRIFLVPKKDSSFRPVINSKLLNQFLAKAHFSTLQVVEPGMIRDLLREADWMAFIRFEGSLNVSCDLGGILKVSKVYACGWSC